MFAPNQVEMLEASLDTGRIAHRKKQGQTLSYLEGFDVIEAANAIFGYDGWGYIVTRLDQVGTVWYATVRVTVNAGGDLVEREDVGVGIPAAKAGETPSAESVETAIKASLTDSLKRALRTFGDQFGNGLYDKDADHGEGCAAQQRPAQRQEQQREEPDLTLIQKGVWDRLKKDWQAAKVPKEKVDADAKAYLHDVLHLEHWGKLSAAQWREFESVMHADITGEDPNAPRKCPACGADMVERSGNKNGREWRALMCANKCGQAPMWLN